MIDFQAALVTVGRGKDEVVFVDDAAPNIEGARAIGITYV